MLGTGMRVAVGLLGAVLAAGTSSAQNTLAPQRHGDLFPLQDLGLLEAPDRDIWQKPDQIMDALAIADGSRVADIGAGAGWFTTRLARRVAREGLQNVATRLGQVSDPNLLDGTLDSILVVDVYPEVEDRVTFLRNLACALRPCGRLGIVNYTPGLGGPGSAPGEGVRVERELVAEHARAAGLQVIDEQDPVPLSARIARRGARTLNPPGSGGGVTRQCRPTTRQRAGTTAAATSSFSPSASTKG